MSADIQRHLGELDSVSESLTPRCEDCGNTGIVGDEGTGRRNARHEWHPCDCPAGEKYRVVSELSQRGIEELKKERDELRDWKKSAMDVESEWDEQELSKLLGGRPGQSCRKVIDAGVRRLIAENARLRTDRDALLKAMRFIAALTGPDGEILYEGGCRSIASFAIAAAEEASTQPKPPPSPRADSSATATSCDK